METEQNLSRSNAESALAYLRSNIGPTVGINHIHQYLCELEGTVKQLEHRIKTLEKGLVWLVWEKEWQESPCLLNIWSNPQDAAKEVEFLQSEDTDGNSNFHVEERKILPAPPAEQMVTNE